MLQQLLQRREQIVSNLLQCGYCNRFSMGNVSAHCSDITLLSPAESLESAAYTENGLPCVLATMFPSASCHSALLAAAGQPIEEV